MLYEVSYYCTETSETVCAYYRTYISAFTASAKLRIAGFRVQVNII